MPDIEVETKEKKINTMQFYVITPFLEESSVVRGRESYGDSNSGT